MTFLTQTISVGGKHKKPLREKNPTKKGFNEHLKPSIKVFELEQLANRWANTAAMQ